MSNNFRSSLSKAKGLGSSGFGSGHWLHQRFSAIILVITGIWVTSFFVDVANADMPDGNIGEVISILQKPQNIVMLALFALASFYHSYLGMQVIIEDYISSRFTRLILLLLMQLFCIITASAFIVAILYII